jgi:CRP-like cAMP-binding protein
VGNNAKILPAVQLEYEAGDLIVKQGDWGISVYYILEGKVGIYIHSGNEEVLLNSMGPGEIVGEMIFLTGYNSTRSASIRAIEPSVLESWHPSRIKQEYDEMPLIIRKMANQMVNQLIKVDKTISQLHRNKRKKQTENAESAKRMFKNREYRKSVYMDCKYRPMDSDKHIRLWGRIKNISKGGLRLEVMRMNALDYPHEVGGEFEATLYASNGKNLHLNFRIANTQIHEKERTLSIGAQITEMDDTSKTELGFLLLA